MGQDTHVIIAFIIAIVVLLGADLFLMGRNSHKVSMKEAGIWTLVFIASALGFAWFVDYDLGRQPAIDFLNAYVIEKTLSVDNLFVFIVVFSAFKVPDEYQHKVLFWGIFGAIILRLIFIFAGVELMHFANLNIMGLEVNLLIFVFGAFLLFAGIKTGISALSDEEEDEDYKASPGARFIKWLFPRVTDQYHGDKFFVKQEIEIRSGDLEYDHLNGDMHHPNVVIKLVRYATPLLVVVGVIEFTDLLFAVDSIPAIFSVSDDPFILYSSNIFAILGLRSMYFLLAGMLPLFRYLNHGLALILAFIGTKMVIAPWYHFDSTLSLYIVLGVLTTSVVVSLIANKLNPEKEDGN